MHRSLPGTGVFCPREIQQEEQTQIDIKRTIFARRTAARTSAKFATTLLESRALLLHLQFDADCVGSRKDPGEALLIEVKDDEGLIVGQ